MKIKSNFKDYYDFCGGLGDPRVVYNRVPFAHEIILKGTVPPIHGMGLVLTKWLVVCGRLYLLDNLSGDYKLSNLQCVSKAYWSTDTFAQGVLSETALRWCREVKSPVFYVRTVGRHCSIPVRLPVLAELGFASVVKPEQMYQDIAYFVGNTIFTNPDIACPVIVSEKDRIVGHGFDLKTSFRGKQCKN